MVKTKKIDKNIEKKEEPFYYSEQWHLKVLGVQQVWEQGIKGNEIKVGVLDEPIDKNHPDIILDKSLGVIVDIDTQSSKTFQNHGTMVGGIIGAKGNVYCYGIAPECSLASYPLVPNFEKDVFNKLKEDINKLDILSNSWGLFNEIFGGIISLEELKKFDLLELMVKFSEEGRRGKGGVVCFSSGNEKNEFTFTRAYYNQKDFIIIGAVSKSLLITSYSTTGPAVLCCAPSGPNFSSNTAEFGIVTTNVFSDDFHPVSYTMNGTSASCPIVSGVIALMLDYRPELTIRDVKEVLSRGCVVHGNNFFVRNGDKRPYSVNYGFGIPYLPKIMKILNQWKLLPPQTEISKEINTEDLDFQNNEKEFAVNVEENIYIENIKITLETEGEGTINDLAMIITSPQNFSVDISFSVSSNSLNLRNLALQIGIINISDNFKKDPIIVEGFRGEKSKGMWKISVKDIEKLINEKEETPKILKHLKLTIYGY